MDFWTALRVMGLGNVASVVVLFNLLPFLQAFTIALVVAVILGWVIGAKMSKDLE